MQFQHHTTADRAQELNGTFGDKYALFSLTGGITCVIFLIWLIDLD